MSEVIFAGLTHIHWGKNIVKFSKPEILNHRKKTDAVFSNMTFSKYRKKGQFVSAPALDLIHPNDAVQSNIHRRQTSSQLDLQSKSQISPSQNIYTLMKNKLASDCCLLNITWKKTEEEIERFILSSHRFKSAHHRPLLGHLLQDLKAPEISPIGQPGTAPPLSSSASPLFITAVLQHKADFIPLLLAFSIFFFGSLLTRVGEG